MTDRTLTVSLILLVAVFTAACSRDEATQSIFNQLDGPYLGQNPPGNSRQLFAPDILAGSLFNMLIYFPAGGEEVYFTSGFEKPFYFTAVFYSHMEDGGWTEPVEIPVDRFVFHRPVLSPDGARIYFLSGSAHKKPDDDTEIIKIYYIDKTTDGWSEPTVIDFGEAFPYSCSQTSIASSGNLYFQAGYHIDGDEDIYIARYQNGGYDAPERLSDAINGPEHDVHPFVAPDESYLIFDGQRPGGMGNHDLYISFRTGEGEWTEAVNMGPAVNSEGDERRASVSFDRKYLFFEGKVPDAASRLPEQPQTLQQLRDFSVSAGNGNSDFYWVDASVIEDLKPGKK